MKKAILFFLLSVSLTCVSNSLFAKTDILLTALPAYIQTSKKTPEPDISWWKPSPGTSWQIQYHDTLDTSLNVTMYDVDLVETSQQAIDQLHADGRIVVCYFSAGSWEEYRDDASDYSDSKVSRFF